MKKYKRLMQEAEELYSQSEQLLNQCKKDGGEWKDENEKKFDELNQAYSNKVAEATEEKLKEEKYTQFEKDGEKWKKAAKDKFVDDSIDETAIAKKEEETNAVAKKAELYSLYKDYIEAGVEIVKVRAENLKYHTKEELYASMMVSDAAHGGVLAPDVTQAAYIQAIEQYSVLAAKCRKVPIVGKSAIYPVIKDASGSKYPSTLRGSYVAEQDWTVASLTPQALATTFVQVQLGMYLMQPIAVSPLLVRTSIVDVLKLIGDLCGRTRATDLDGAICTGTGANGSPIGILDAASAIPTVPMALGTAITDWTLLVTLDESLPKQYRSASTSYVMNSKTRGSIRKLVTGVTTSGSLIPIFNPAVTPLTVLFDTPITIVESMPDIGAGTIPIIIGDMSWYGLATDPNLEILELREKYAPAKALLGYTFDSGAVLLADAFRGLKVAATLLMAEGASEDSKKEDESSKREEGRKRG